MADRKTKPDKQKSRRREPSKLSRLHKPAGMTLEAWQTALRQQYGREQKFRLQNLGEDPVFSDFQITNPTSQSSYRVAIRGSEPGVSFCSCPDFATNTLGTCKHIEFTLAKLSKRSANRAVLRRGFEPEYSEVLLRYGAHREVRLRLGQACPAGLARIARRYFDAEGRLREGAFARFDSFLASSSRFEHELRCHEDALAFIAELRDRTRREEILDKAFPKGAHSSPLDSLLRVPLYDYQREGALFAARAGRSLIGDEMGLGKTIQALAAAEIMAAHFGVERVLIVCPTSLKHQWEREIVRFVGRKTMVIGGLRGRREQNFAADAFFKILNYDTVHRDLDLIAAWSPDLVILDEAQRIKNWNTRAARSVKQITSPFAIVLTGTPLENRLEELVSIVQFVDRHRLGPTFRFLADHQIHDPETGQVTGYKDLDSIGRTLQPILLRRRKSEVLGELPERLDKNFFVPMTPQQMVHHGENREIVARLVHKWRRFKFLSEADQRRLMIALQNMRMSCDSTYLLDQKTDFGVKAEELSTLLAEIFEQPGSKVVIFSQWLRMHELLVRRLERRDWGHVLFHGSIPSARRKDLVDRFREQDDCRAFLATDSGGVGLNLQHASTVINMDLPWNPAVLEQRIGRVHRLGQRQPVRVVNFVAQGTIEEGMLSVLKFKKSLFDGALDGGQNEVFLGGSRLSRFIDTVEKATTSIPEPAAADPSPDRSERDEQLDSLGSRGLQSGSPSTTAMESQAATDPWAGLLQTGLTLLEQFAVAARSHSSGQARTGGAAAIGNLLPIQRDPLTGQTYLRLPVPGPDLLDRALAAIGSLLDRSAPPPASGEAVRK